jgi:HEAT repeat protein
MNAAKALGCRLSADTAAMLLRHADPDVRAPAARCAPLSGDIPAILADLLDDLHPQVALAAAVALGRAGRAAARPALLRLLGNQPSAELINAIAPVADGTVIVLLGRIARAWQRPRSPRCGTSTTRGRPP